MNNWPSPTHKSAVVQTIYRANYAALVWNNPSFKIMSQSTSMSSWPKVSRMASRGWHLDADRLLSCPDNSTACEMGMQRSLCTISCSCNKNNLKCTDSCSACEATCEIRVETLRNVRNDDESNYEITDCTIGVYNITLNLFAFIRRDCCSNLLQQRCH